jgi:hypothetical protein
MSQGLRWVVDIDIVKYFDSIKVRTAGCDLLRFVGDKVATKNAFRKVRG